jgi:hypothetical protein
VNSLRQIEEDILKFSSYKLISIDLFPIDTDCESTREDGNDVLYEGGLLSSTIYEKLEQLRFTNYAEYSTCLISEMRYDYI